MGSAEGEAFSTETSKENYGFLNLTFHPHGSVTRKCPFPLTPPIPQQENSQHSVFSKDIILNPTHKTWFRIFKPAQISQNEKLPIIIYFHGGGFIFFSADIIPFHALCEKFARELPALILSVGYRIAPENRLPAAYDDAIEAVNWVRDHISDEPWLRDYGDFSRCFLMGSSAGANIIYHAGFRAMEMDLKPLKITGLIFDQVFFGGTQRTESELRLVEDPVLPLRACDLMWRLALPDGADRDHEFCNMAHQGKRGLLFPRCLVRGWKADPLYDRQREFAEMLKKSGVQVMVRLEEDGHHAIEYHDPQKAQSLLMDVKDFLDDIC